MKPRLALLLILVLLAPSLAAMATAAGEGTGRTILVCTDEGAKRIALDPGGNRQKPSPSAAHACPCGILCTGCPGLRLDRVGSRLALDPDPSRVLRPGRDVPRPATAPPTAHRSRAPPPLG
ncbi:MAG: hypothetical protein KDG89_05860 [Geminicoccaceae bacterium]|nr:hypothetical protein [Geminicoccaceae bacterium]